MSRMRFVTCISLTGSLWGLAAFAQSLDGVRAAFEEGRFGEASELAAAVGTSEALALAAETPPRDAYERILQEQARAGLAALDGP